MVNLKRAHSLSKLRLWTSPSLAKLCDIELLLHGLNLEYLSDIMLVSSVPLHTHTQTQEYLWHCLSTVPHPHCDWTVFRFPYLPHAISQHMVLSNTCPTLLLAYWCWAGRCKDCGSDWSDWVKNYSVWSSVWGGGGGLIFSSLDWIDIPVTSSSTTQTHTVIGYRF